MKALTIHQPWASLIALGVKRIETRSWTTKYRGPLAIHAGARPIGNGCLSVGSWTNVTGEPIAGDQQMMAGPWSQEPDAPPTPSHLPCPLAAVVARSNLLDCVPMVDEDAWDEQTPSLVIGPDTLTYFADGWDEGLSFDQERPYGLYEHGRAAWIFGGVVALASPVPARGRQGLWEWEETP